MALLPIKAGMDSALATVRIMALGHLGGAFRRNELLIAESAHSFVSQYLMGKF